MCDHADLRLDIAAPMAARGSRRYRLWELPPHTHCPVIGVCLPMPVLRRLIGKALGNQVTADDYDFHVAAVSECGRRMPIAEALQRELDRRYAPALRRLAQAKTTDALAILWAAALRGSEVAGALWATLSHPRCSEDLREQVCRDIHMFQHQVGACNRADLLRAEQMRDENEVLSRELAASKERLARTCADRSEQVVRLQSELLEARTQAITADAALGAAQMKLEIFRGAAPDLPCRLKLEALVEEQRRRIHELEHENALLRQQPAHSEACDDRAQDVERDTSRHGAACGEPAAERPPSEAVANLHHKAILCVGGRTASIPLYRRLIECSGGRFLHHDGGKEDGAAQLEANLAAADLVICQTGCISHGAYWRVKDHCKRTGKRCLFVDKPSTTSLERTLQRYSAGLPVQDGAPGAPDAASTSCDHAPA